MCEKCEQCREEQALGTGREGEERTRQRVETPETLRDWHRADILAAVRKRGSSLAALSRRAGLADTTLSNVLYRPWPKGEKIVADFLGIPMCHIWPERYSLRGIAE